MSIDEIDLRILDMLQRNGKLSQARIAGATLSAAAFAVAVFIAYFCSIAATY